MRWRWIGTLLLLASLTGFAQAPPPSPSLPSEARLQAEALKLRAENLQLRQALLSCQAQHTSQQLEADRIRLEQTFRELLNPPPASRFNWSTLSFEASKPE